MLDGKAKITDFADRIRIVRAKSLIYSNEGAKNEATTYNVKLFRNYIYTEVYYTFLSDIIQKKFLVFLLFEFW